MILRNFVGSESKVEDYMNYDEKHEWEPAGLYLLSHSFRDIYMYSHAITMSLWVIIETKSSGFRAYTSVPVGFA